MSIIGTIVVGFIVGLIARAIKPGDDRMGLIMTTLLGIAGAFFATWIGQMLGWYRPDQGAGLIGALGAPWTRAVTTSTSISMRTIRDHSCSVRADADRRSVKLFSGRRKPRFSRNV